MRDTPRPVPQPKPDKALLERAAAGRDVVRYAAGDPEIVLALVVWPSAELLGELSQSATVERRSSLSQGLRDEYL